MICIIILIHSYKVISCLYLYFRQNGREYKRRESIHQRKLSSVEDTCTVYVQEEMSTVEDTCIVYVQEENVKEECRDIQGSINCIPYFIE